MAKVVDFVRESWPAPPRINPPRRHGAAPSRQGWSMVKREPLSSEQRACPHTNTTFRVGGKSGEGATNEKRGHDTPDGKVRAHVICKSGTAREHSTPSSSRRPGQRTTSLSPSSTPLNSSIKRTALSVVLPPWLAIPSLTALTDVSRPLASGLLQQCAFFSPPALDCDDLATLSTWRAPGLWPWLRPDPPPAS